MTTISRVTAMTALLALGLISTPARASDRNGAAVEIHLGGVRSIPGAGFVFGGFDTGIFGGYRLKRVIFGLGFDLVRQAEKSGGTTSTTDALTFLLFSPGVRVALVRSSDHRIELFGFFNAGFGTVLTGSGSKPEATAFLFSYQVGPGIRYWLHPQFSIAGTGGVRGDFQFDLGDTVGSRSAIASTSIFGQLQILAVF